MMFIVYIDEFYILILIAYGDKIKGILNLYKLLKLQNFKIWKKWTGQAPNNSLKKR